MKNILKTVCLLLAFAATSCVKEVGNYDYNEINEIHFKGINDAYSKISGVDTLRIFPSITATEGSLDTNRFVFRWVAKNDTLSDTVGRSLNLIYPVKLAPLSYQLYLRILDKKTNILWKTKTDLNISTAYTRGFFVSTEDVNGFVKVDMITMAGDTVIRRDILKNSGLPALKGAINVQHSGGNVDYSKLWVFSTSGSYFVDRLSLAGNVDNRFSRLVYLTDNIDKSTLTPVLFAPQIIHSSGNVGNPFLKALYTQEGYIFTANPPSNGGDYYSNPINRDRDVYAEILPAAPYLIYPLANMSSLVWYDTKNERFMNYPSFYGLPSSVQLKDNANDIFPWNQKNSGRTLLYAENTRNTDAGATNGNSFTLMKDASNQHFIYKFYANGANPNKLGFYVIKPIATDFDKADFYAFSSNRTVVFYAVKNRLYAYDYNPGNEKFYAFNEFNGDKITLLKFDTQVDPGTNSLYIATFNAATKGTLRRYIVGNNPNTIALTAVPHADWTGFEKIKNISWRAVN